MGMTKSKRTFARTIRNSLRAPHMKMWGFEAKRARKFTRTLPRTLPWNFIAMLSAPPRKCAERRKNAPSCTDAWNTLVHFLSKTKRGRREGAGKKNVTTICNKRQDNLQQTSRQFTNLTTNWRHFMTISVSLSHCHKTP